MTPTTFKEVHALFEFTIVAIEENLRADGKAELKMLKALYAGVQVAQADQWAKLMVEKVIGISDAKRSSHLRRATHEH